MRILILFLFTVFLGVELQAQQNTIIMEDYPTIRVLLPDDHKPITEQSWFNTIIGVFNRS
ncbi:MAG: hypothetical protein IPN88_15970 [Bacteroidetes bacterium]|nr:hypothetical protein [Bacteroidota bacterium]